MTPRRVRALALSTLLLGCRRPETLPAGTGVAVDGQQDLVVVHGKALPLFVPAAGKAEAGICLRLAPEIESGSWRGRLAAGRSGLSRAAFAKPRARAASTLCFAQSLTVPAPGPSGGENEICLEVEDAYDARRFDPVCRPARFLPSASRWNELFGELEPALGHAAPEERIAALDALARRARTEGFAGLAITCALIASDLRRNEGTPAALADAERRLGALPDALGQPGASFLAGQAAYQRALIDLERGRLAAAWRHLAEADEKFLAVAARLRLAVAMRRGEIRGRLGAAAEGAAELRRELLGCATAGCDPALVPSVEAELAWLVLLDPDAESGALEDAERRLQQAIPRLDADERANHRIDLALLSVRRGGDPRAPLAAVRSELRGQAGARPDLLRAWADLVEGQGALVRGTAEPALALCGRAAGGAAPPLAAWASSCVAAAERRRGDLGAAEGGAERALMLHELAAGEPFEVGFPLGSSQRADDFYAAARIAVEAGRPERAWEILDRLDALGAGGAAPPAVRRERDRLAARLVALEAPASAARQAELRPALDRLRSEIQELARTSRPAEGRATEPNRADLRAFALPDEILLLARDEEGIVRLARRTPIARRDLRALLARIEGPRGATLSDADLRRMLAPLSRALVPPPGFEGEGWLVYALYGPLQKVPLAALPAGSKGGGAWLADRLTPVLAPARVAVSAEDARPGTLGGQALFVVDPQGNLAAARELSALYRRLFPRAGLLAGPAATRSAVETAFRSADRIHFDVHGRFDPDFPELSSLAFADGPLSLARLTDWPVPRELANLSGCSTAAGPVTADGGRYGFAGRLAAGGTPWVVAVRAPLSDALARDFNRAFYAELAAAGDPVRSFRKAHETVRRSWPAAEWSKLVLLSGGRRAGGQSPAAPTPSREERIRGAVKPGDEP